MFWGGEFEELYEKDPGFREKYDAVEKKYISKLRKEHWDGRDIMTLLAGFREGYAEQWKKNMSAS